MARFFIDRPVFAIVLSLLITIIGAVAIFTLPIAQYPQITAPKVSVTTNYLGANAEVVEQSVAQAIEQQVNGIEGMVDMDSTSDNNGGYTLNVKFNLGVNGAVSAVQVQNRVGQANSQLPSEVITSGIVTKEQSADTAMFFSVYSPNNTYDDLFLKNYASINIIDDLKRISGIGNISEYGPEFSMRIWLKPDKMSALGITSDDVANAIKSQNIQAPVGSIGKMPSLAEQQFEYSAQAQGRLVEVKEFEEIIIKALPDGSSLKLKDVASVKMSAKDYTMVSTFNAGGSVVFAINLTPTANSVSTLAEVRKQLDAAEKRFPDDMKVQIVTDSTKFIEESLKEVLKTFVEALFLVLIIVFIFLQSWEATLIPMIAVPVSLIGTFGSFILLGFNINTLTMFAMVLAIGLVVDDAIVVVEAVEHNIKENHLAPKEATYKAMEEVSGPVVAIAFVLASVFIPVAFFGGTVGVLYQQFALTITVSMALSAIVALSLTPALCAILLKKHDANEKKGLLGKFFDKFNKAFDKMTNWYIAGVHAAIKYSKTSLIALVAVSGIAFLLFTVLPSGFVPDEDQGYFLGSISLPEASSSMRTQAVGREISRKIREIEGVVDVIFVAGIDITSNSPKSSSGLVAVSLDDWSKRTTAETQVKSIIGKTMAIGATMPEATIMAFNAPALPGASSTGSLTLMVQDRSGGTVDELGEKSNQLISALRKRPEIGAIFSTFRADTPGYRFDIDRQKAEKLGVPVSSVFTALQTYLGGSQINDFNRFGRTWKVIMQAEPEFRADVDTLRFFFVKNTAGEMVPLSTLVKSAEITGPTTVTRYNGLRSFKVGGSPAAGYSSGQAMTAIEEVFAEVMPNTYSYEWTDQSRDEKSSAGRSTIIFAFAIIFTFLCLSALYESWTVPFAVLFSVPTAIMGAAGFQYLRGFQNDVYMQIGLIMLIGLAAKNAILIVEFAKMGVDDGVELVEATISACKLRLRPILMTSLAFIIGCLPLVIASGAGAGSRNSMGTAVVGGMLVATCLGIFIIPVLFVVVERMFGKKEQV